MPKRTIFGKSSRKKLYACRKNAAKGRRLQHGSGHDTRIATDTPAEVCVGQGNVDANVGAVAMPCTSSQSASGAQVDSESDAEDMPGTLSVKRSGVQVVSEPDAEDKPDTFCEETSLADVDDSEIDAEDMPGTSGVTSQDSSGKEIKVFCPKCNTKISHTAGGIQEDQTKILVAKVYHYFEQEYEELKKMYGDLDLTPLSKFRQRTSLATGVSETTLLQILKEEEERNASKLLEPLQIRPAPRKRRRQTDSSSDEGNSDDQVNEQPSYVDEVQTLVVKMEPPEYHIDEPEIFLPMDVKVEPGPSEIDKAQLQSDPISLDVKTEPRADEVDTTNETYALYEPAATERRGRKISRKNDDTSTRQHTTGESSAPVASSSAPHSGTLHESFLSGEREIKIEDIEIQEGFS